MGKRFMKRVLAILCAAAMAASNAACVLPVNAEEVSAAQDEDEALVQTAAAQTDGNTAEPAKSDNASSDEEAESADNASLKESVSSDDAGSQETASADQAASQDENSDENADAGNNVSDQASASAETAASDISVSSGSEQTPSSTAVSVTATYVDEFGDAIGTQYSNLSLPDFSDTLSFEKGSTPIKDFQVTDGKFKVTDYSFEKASINGTTITAIKKEAASATDSTAVYSYTSDGTAWTKLTADTNISVTFNDGTKTVYTYEDNDVTVTATLQHANAIPDNAELKVTPVTKTTSGYNYDAYMQAVNSNAEAVASVKGSSDSTGSDGTQNAFNENNSRLYDIAFISDKTDENGNAISGEKQEYEPTEGSVKISMSFKNKQLTNDIKADNDVSIIHLSLSDDAKKNADTTAEAKDITSSDVKVQVVSSSTPITTGSSDQVSYDLSSFSLVLYAGSGTADSPVGGTDTYLSILGQARFYGIVANEWTQNEAETNAAVKVINANAQTGTDMTNVATQPWIVGKINGELHFKQGSNAVDLWCTYDDTSKITNQTGKDIAYHYASETDLDAAVDTLLSTPKAASTAMANVSGKVQLDNSKYVTITKDESGNESDYKIDLTSLPKGTYYVDSTEMNLTTNGNLHIFINSDQYIVFTNRSDTVTLQQYDVTIGGTKINAGSVGASGTGYGDTPIVAEHVYWNMPNATTVSFGTSSSGLFLAPKATVTIENSCNGWIVANKVINKGGEWHSVYQKMDKSYTQPASTVFAAKKTVNTAAPDASQIFDFNLDKWDSTSSKWVNVATARNSGTDVIFPNVSFTEAGTFIYKISENLPADSIYELANGAHASYYVKVVVVKTTIGQTDYYNITSTKYYQNFNNGTVDGELQNSNPSYAVINNTYKSKIKLCVTKAFSGRELTDADSFTFTLTAGTNDAATGASPMPASKGGDTVTVKKGSLTGTFGEIEFTKAGTYNYKIKETVPTGAVDGKYQGIQYDTNEHTATVVVADSGQGTLTVTSLTYDDGQKELTVKNTYGTASVKKQLGVTKAFSGRELTDADSFTFTLTAGTNDAATGASPMPASKGGDTVTVKKGSLTGTFGEIEFTKAGTYHYDIKENASGIAGVTDDTTTHKAVVTVKDKDNNGKFTITVKYDDTDKNAAVFTDTYSASGSTQLKVDKNFTGRDWAKGDAFTFTLTGEKDAPMPTGTSGSTLTITYDSKNHTGLFGSISYTKDGTYTYDITENASGIAGVTDDKMTHHAVVTVEDKDNNGKFTINVKYDDTDKDAAVFTDTYAASGSTQLKVDKNFTGRDWAEGDKFTFTLTGEKDAPMPKEDSGKELTIAYNSTSTDHTGLFGEINYTKAGVYIYDITEKASGIAGVTDDTTTHKAVVTVEDKDHNGKFTITVKYDDTDKDAAAFTDTYAASGSTQLKVDKNFTGRDWAVGDKFTFTLKAEENAPMPTGTSGSTLTITYDSKDHTGLFGSISYTKAGTYTYDITEKASGLGGVTDDATTHKAVVTVEDKDHNGKFTITVKYDNKDSDAAVFTDTYTASGSTQLKVDKNFTGRDWAVGDKFTFTLKAEENAPMPTGTDGNTLTITYDSKDHTGLFGEISYTKAGTYTYDITENASGLGGVTDDKMTHHAVVTVEDKEHNGKFTITVKYDNTDKDAAVFTDTYGAVGSITFSGTKTLKDGTLSGNEFSFTVKEGDSIVATGTNDKNGKITFTSIPYTLSDVGEHTYTVTETVGTKDGVQYDTTCYTVTVKVTDNHDGTLKIEPSSDYTKLNFTNTISSTTTSTTSTTSSSSVKTGDDSPIALYFILLLFSGAAAALFVTDMKKKKNSGNQ